MNGLIALVGAGEYLPVMEDVDRYLLRLGQSGRTRATRRLSANRRGSRGRREHWALVKNGLGAFPQAGCGSGSAPHH